MAIFVGLVVFGEALTVNTILGGILIIGGGAIPSIKGMLSARKMRKKRRFARILPLAWKRKKSRSTCSRFGGVRLVLGRTPFR